MKAHDILSFAPVNEIDNTRVEELTKSIKSNGWQGMPILVHELQGCLITGSHRLAALKNLETDLDWDGYLDDLGDVAEPVDDIIEAYCAENDCTIDELPYDNLGAILQTLGLENIKTIWRNGKMTNREAYIFGFVYGLCEQKLKRGTNTGLAAARPFSGLAAIITKAHQQGVLDDELDSKIAAALWEIENVSPEEEDGSEKYQPLEIQGSWHLGYYRGVNNKPLPPKPLDIKEAREQKGLSQKALAEQLGVAQTLVSCWETGKSKPSTELEEKIHAILD